MGREKSGVALVGGGVKLKWETKNKDLQLRKEELYIDKKLEIK